MTLFTTIRSDEGPFAEMVRKTRRNNKKTEKRRKKSRWPLGFFFVTSTIRLITHSKFNILWNLHTFLGDIKSLLHEILWCASRARTLSTTTKLEWNRSGRVKARSEAFDRIIFGFNRSTS
jgi:hypothetical protein